MAKRHFLTLRDFSRQELLSVIDRALEYKSLLKSNSCPQKLKGKALALVFEKSSTRTRVSFEVAMFHMGGYSTYLNQDMSQLGRGESYGDTARVLSRYVHGIVFRTYLQDRLMEFARHATVPVINGLSDLFHPCQLVADLVTLKERKLDLEKMTVSYVGDGNNMAHSWMLAAAVLGFKLRVAVSREYNVDEVVKNSVHDCANIVYFHDAKEAVRGCSVINTDTWFSMGQEVSEAKRAAFKPFQVNRDLLRLAEKDAVVLHCLPAHRGDEITDEVMDGKQSAVFDQAENRLHAHMAILEKLMT